MTVQPGARLGPYEVVSAIGAGSMGEVYRAKDRKLHRDVAVKVLPESLARVTPGASDARRRRRPLPRPLMTTINLRWNYYGSHQTFRIINL